MTTPVRTRIKKSASLIVSSTVAAAALAGSIAITATAYTNAVAHSQPPSPGDSCSVLHQTTTDADGQTMWCNSMMTGTHGLVWQYGGPA